MTSSVLQFWGYFSCLANKKRRIGYPKRRFRIMELLFRKKKLKAKYYLVARCFASLFCILELSDPVLIK